MARPASAGFSRDALWIVLPVKPLAEGKSRLMPGGADRHAINQAFCHHVMHVACQTIAPEHVVVVSRDEAVLAMGRRAGARALREGEGDLNDALAFGAGFARARGASGILSLFADLPFLTRGDLLAMISAFDGTNLVIAPDEDGSGSNALLMAPGALPYRHGPGSFWRHLDAARETSCAFGIIRREGLMCDIDVPAHLARLPATRPHEHH